MILSYFFFPTTCLHCYESILKNTGICKDCFSSLTLLDVKKEGACNREVQWQTSLFPKIDPLIDVFGQALEKNDRKMIALFSALLVLQAAKLNAPWCDVIFLVPKEDLSYRTLRIWQECLERFFKAPSSLKKAKSVDTVYLIDWFKQENHIYHTYIQGLKIKSPKKFVLLTIFSNY